MIAKGKTTMDNTTEELPTIFGGSIKIETDCLDGVRVTVTDSVYETRAVVVLTAEDAERLSAVIEHAAQIKRSRADLDLVG